MTLGGKAQVAATYCPNERSHLECLGPKERRKSSDLSRRWNSSSDVDDRTSSGRLFQTNCIALHLSPGPAHLLSSSYFFLYVHCNAIVLSMPFWFVIFLSPHQTFVLEPDPACCTNRGFSRASNIMAPLKFSSDRPLLPC